MPHLAPMNWMIAIMIFWSMLFMLASIMWWHQMPKFQSQTKNLTFNFPLWNW